MKQLIAAVIFEYAAGSSEQAAGLFEQAGVCKQTALVGLTPQLNSGVTACVAEELGLQLHALGLTCFARESLKSDIRAHPRCGAPRIPPDLACEARYTSASRGRQCRRVHRAKTN